MSVDSFVEAAKGALLHAYAPYSGFAVGAAALADGHIFTGVNVENASLPLSMCAERDAIGAMVAAGHKAIDDLLPSAFELHRP